MSESLVFPYTEFPSDECNEAFPNGHTPWRPVLSVSLLNGEQSVYCEAFVDTAADHCTFPSKFLSALRLDGLAKTYPNLRGATGDAQAFFCEVTLDLGFSQPYVVYAAFSENMNNWGDGHYGLLGHAGFFDRFQVCFDTCAKRFAIASEQSQPSA